MKGLLGARRVAGRHHLRGDALERLRLLPARDPLGGAARCQERLLAQAERAVTDELRIDQPGVYANLATSHNALGDEPERQRLLSRALDSAKGLENARPRALAVVTICRALGQHGIDPDDPARARLDALYDGLKAPW